MKHFFLKTELPFLGNIKNVDVVIKSTHLESNVRLNSKAMMCKTSGCHQIK